jgi:uncharacterized sodium:solute symporter family permease YidK
MRKHVLWTSVGCVTLIAIWLISKLFFPDIAKIGVGLPIILYLAVCRAAAKSQNLFKNICLFCFCILFGVLVGTYLDNKEFEMNLSHFMIVGAIGSIIALSLSAFHSSLKNEKHHNGPEAGADNTEQL